MDVTGLPNAGQLSQEDISGVLPSRVRKKSFVSQPRHHHRSLLPAITVATSGATEALSTSPVTLGHPGQPHSSLTAPKWTLSLASHIRSLTGLIATLQTEVRRHCLKLAKIAFNQ